MESLYKKCFQLFSAVLSVFSGEKSAVFSVFSGQKFFRPADLGFKTPIFPLESFTSESYSFKMGILGALL